MIVWILRGLSGAGKSTFSKCFENGHIVSADFHHTYNGVYKYDVKNVQRAHGLCLKEFTELVRRQNVLPFEDYDHLIVDNTNIHLEYISPYVRLAQAYELEFYIVEFRCTIEEAIARNVHGTPDEAIRRMYNAMDTVQLPKSWPVCKIEEMRFGGKTYTPGQTVVRRSDWLARDASGRPGKDETLGS